MKLTQPSPLSSDKMIALLVIVGAVGLAQCQQNVAFSTGLMHDATYPHDDIVVFDKVFTNLGNGYDVTTGKFTCPVAGIYGFQFHSMSHLNKSTWLELYKNNNYVASIYGHSSTDYASGGNSVVLKLNIGDEIYIKAVDQQFGYLVTIYGRPDEIYTTFSGYLLAPVLDEVAPVGK